MVDTESHLIQGVSHWNKTMKKKILIEEDLNTEAMVIHRLELETTSIKLEPTI